MDHNYEDERPEQDWPQQRIGDRHPRAWKALRILAVIQMVSALLLMIIWTANLGVFYINGRVTRESIRIFAYLFFLITASIGVAGIFRKAICQAACNLNAYLVLLILTALGSFAVMAVDLYLIDRIEKEGPYVAQVHDQGLWGFHLALLIASTFCAAVLFVGSTVSGSLLCLFCSQEGLCACCCSSQPTTQIVYFGAKQEEAE